MRNLTERQFKDLVLRSLDESNFFAILRDHVLGVSSEEDEGGLVDALDNGKLPKDLSQLEGKCLVPKSARYTGVVAQVRGGRIHLKGRTYTSPSDAAKSVTGSSVNGRIWWRVR